MNAVASLSAPPPPSLGAAEENEDFQLPKKSKRQQAKHVRVYVGNLPQKADGLEALLLEFLSDKANLTNVLSEKDISVQKQNGNKSNSCHAFISCPSNQVADNVVASLHRQFLHNHALKVQRERKQRRASVNNAPHNGKQHQKQQVQSTSSFGKKSWSKPPPVKKTQRTNIAKNKYDHRGNSQLQSGQITIYSQKSNGVNSYENESATDFMSQMIATEMGEACATGNEDTARNTELASLAALSMMAPAMRVDSLNSSINHEGSHIEDNLTNAYEQAHPQANMNVPCTINGFKSRCQQPLSDLMKDYGEEDPEWCSFQPTMMNSVEDNSTHSKQRETRVATLGDFKSRCQQPFSELMNDYGKEDPDWRAFQPNMMNTLEKTDIERDALKITTQESFKAEESTDDRLGRQGKAPIHIEFVSFGYIHGVPAAIRNGWSHAQPLPAFDCRDLPEVPSHLTWRNGCSGLVQSKLMAEPDVKAMAVNIGDETSRALQEAIAEGEHGYVSPLEMKVYVGSENGKHRSVVVCENAAKALRTFLRKNENDCVGVLTSVATVHRDVERAKKKGATQERNTLQKEDLEW